jgi:choline-glycine betaine transporter
MAQDTELQALREELKKIQDQTRRSRKRAAVGFVILVLVVILSLVYAFVQQVAAERNAEEALRQRKLAEMSEQQAIRNAEEAKRQEAVAMAQERLAQERVKELEKCCKKR